MTISRK